MTEDHTIRRPNRRRQVRRLAALAGVALAAAGCQLKTAQQLPVSLYEKQAPTQTLHGRIAYVQSTGSYSSDITVVNVATGDKSKVPTQPGHVEDLTWSPDGSKLAYALQTGTGNAQIWISAPDGSGQRKVTNSGSSVVDPSWSPDGSRIAVATLLPGGWKVALVDATSGAITALNASGAQQRFPTWMPDGSAVVYSAKDSAGRYKLWSYKMSTGASQQLTTGAGDDLYPQVGANGQIVFSSTRVTDSSQTFVRDTNGTTHTVVSSNSVETWPTWSPDQHYVARAAPHLAIYDADGSHLPDGSLRWKLTKLPVASPRWTA